MTFLRATLLATALAFTAPSLANADTPPNALIVAQNIDDIVAIDPAQAFEFTSGEIVTNIYDRLVQYDAEDPTVLSAGLASEWSIDEDAKTITFTVRDGATFHSAIPCVQRCRVFTCPGDQAQSDTGLYSGTARLDCRQCQRNGDRIWQYGNGQI